MSVKVLLDTDIGTDIDDALQKVRDRVDEAKNELPADRRPIAGRHGGPGRIGRVIRRAVEVVDRGRGMAREDGRGCRRR